jgi:hypothetical protein
MMKRSVLAINSGRIIHCEHRDILQIEYARDTYVNPEAVFLPVLFVKTQVTSGGKLSYYPALLAMLMNYF